MPTGLKGSISGPGTDYFTGRPTVSSLVSTCKSFCSYLTSVYHKGFPKGRYLKKKIQTQLMPISLTFLLKSSLVSLVPFEDVFCTGPEQLQPGKGEEEPGGCGAAAGHDSEPAGSTRQRQGSRHGAAPLLQLPSEKKQAWFAAILGSVAVVYPAAFSGPAYSLVITGRFLPCLTHGFFAFLTHHSPSQGGQVIT